MSVSLSTERDRIQRQVDELEKSLSATHTELELLSSDTDDESDGDDIDEEFAAGLLAQREKIQKEIQNLENVLGPHSPVSVSDDDSSSSSEESELGLSLSVDSCLQMNLVYQQVVQETLDQLETLLTHNHRQQKEVMSQLSGPIKESSREQQPINIFLGRFLKPYFKDNLTGLGPPANPETKERVSRTTGCLDKKRLKLKRWESWQKTLLIHSVARDALRRLIQPKLSKVDYLSQKLSSAEETDRQQLRQQIDSLEREIDLLRGRKEDELIGDRYDDHDWQRISNVDFEGTRDAEDIRCFWQNFLHPSINKSRWSQEEVQQLEEVSRRYGERDWETIAAELGTGRTAFLCLQMFQRFVSDSLRHGSWTPDEDALLRELVDKMRIGNFIPYTQMSYFMEGRDPAQLIYRWNQVLDPSLKKGPWTQEEDQVSPDEDVYCVASRVKVSSAKSSGDFKGSAAHILDSTGHLQLLLKAVSCYGEKDWWKIRLEVPGRTDNACRDRYYDCLKVDTKRGPFDKQEKELLLQLVEKHGVGRWAKIAAEIPHRIDAQCLREWRKLSRPAPSPAKNKKTAKKPPATLRGAKTKKKVGPTKRRIRRRLMKVKEEEEEELREEEETVVEYMDSDEEEKKKTKTKEVVEVIRTEEVEKEKVEEEYIIPPMQEWIPVKKEQCFTFLNFRPVELSSFGDTHNGKLVRSTILGQFGRSVIIGPPPRELQWERRHSSSTMMMVSPDQQRAHLNSLAQKFKNLSPGLRGQVQTGNRNHLSRLTKTGLGYELQAALTPWIGNLLIPAKNNLTAADALRERGEKTQLSSSPVFLLLLQALNVDFKGCKEMIEKGRDRMALLIPPPDPSSVRMKNPKTIARTLRQSEAKEELHQQHKLFLNVLQQQEKQKPQQLQQQQPQQPPLPHPSMPQNHPGFLLQPPNMHHQTSPMLFPQAVFISHPVTQPHTASIQLMPPPSLTTPPPAPHRPPHVGVVTPPLPAPAAPQRLNVPPVTVVQMPLNTTSTCSASSPQQAAPLTQNIQVAMPPSSKQHIPVGSILPSQHAVPSGSSNPITCPSQLCATPSPSSSIQNPHKGRRRKVVNDQQTVCSGENQVDLGRAGNAVEGACRGVDGAGGSVVKEGKRIRKLSLKARALQEATEAKAEAKKKAALSARKKAQIQNIKSPPQTGIPVPPQQICTAPTQLVSQTPQLTETGAPSCPSAQKTTPLPPALDVPPVSLNSSLFSVTPACSDRTVSSTQNRSLTPPPSILTNQLTAFSTSSLPALSLKDHDYTFVNLGPTPSQHKLDSIQPTPAPKKPKTLRRKSAPNKPPKAPPGGRKRIRGEEQPSVTSSQDDPCAGRAGDVVGGTGAGVTEGGKRVRKPSERARALQEATQTKAEAKKRRTSSSSPRQKRSRTSCSKQGVVTQNPPVTQVPTLCFSPSWSMWVMTPGGLAQLAEAPPEGLQLALVPTPPLPAPPRNIVSHPSATPPLQLTAVGPQSFPLQPTAVSVPINLPRPKQPHLLPAPPTAPFKPLRPAIIMQPVPNTGSSPVPSCPRQPPPRLFLPHKGTVRADSAVPPPLRREALQFDPSLMFQESRAEVCDWLSSRGGVVVPGAGMALPYLPPFVSSLSTLSALLQAKKSLTKSSLQLLCRGSEPRRSQTKPRPASSTKRTSRQSPDLPDSTTDLGPATDQQAPSVSSDLLQEEAELVAVVRQLVAERFSSNPAYQLLKARFLSCFTVPAFLATVQPITEKTVVRPTNEEEEEKEAEEEEVELNKIKERGKQRRAEKSLLLCDGSGAPANYFSGIINTNTPTTDQSGSDQ